MPNRATPMQDRRRAWYDLGIGIWWCRIHHALEAFDKTASPRQPLVTDAVAQCQTNKSLAQALARRVVAWEKQTQKTRSRPSRSDGNHIHQRSGDRRLAGQRADEDDPQIDRH